MTYWTVSLKGGPKRFNQAAAALGSKIYSFGEFVSQGEFPDNTIFGVHVLDIETYRWYQLLAASHRSYYLPVELYETLQNPQNDNAGSSDGANIRARLSALEEIPCHRVGHSVVTYEGKFYMWGGCEDNLVCCTKMFCFDPEKETWSIIPCIGRVPHGRTRHTAVVYNDTMIIYGGRGHHLTTGFLQSGRELHTACVINGKMYVFGGNDIIMNNFGLDVLDLETGRWEKPEETGEIPCERSSHSAWVYQGMMYIFGGIQSRFHRYLNTLYEFNPETSQWRLLQQYGFGPPIPRKQHCSVIVDSRVFVFGGLMPSPESDELTDDDAILLVTEICDLNVLDYEWKLSDLCFVSLVRNQRIEDILERLPPSMSRKLRLMTTPNYVT